MVSDVWNQKIFRPAANMVPIPVDTRLMTHLPSSANLRSKGLNKGFKTDSCGKARKRQSQLLKNSNFSYVFHVA